MADPQEVQKFEEAAVKFQEREAADGNEITIEEARERLAALLTNLAERPLEIFTLRIGFEELERRVAALEQAAS